MAALLLFSLFAAVATYTTEAAGLQHDLLRADGLHRNAIVDQIKRLEQARHPHLVPDEDVQRLLRVPGIGKAVAFTIRQRSARVRRSRERTSSGTYGVSILVHRKRL